jgi:hypothetical protein
MQHGSPIIHLMALMSFELLALAIALLVFVYIKKQNLNKWFHFSAAAIMGCLLLIMAGTFVGAICMHCCGNRGNENREERMIIRGDMGEGMDMFQRHHRMMGMMHGEGGECREGMECKEGMECERNEKCDMPCCQNGAKCEMDEKGGKCDMSKGKCEMGGMHMKKDTIVEKKGGKK